MALSEMAYPWARYSAMMRERGLSSCSTSRSSPACSCSAASGFSEPGRLSLVEEPVTLTRLEPNWVLSSSSAVLPAVGFSKVTDAVCVEASGVRERLVILPLGLC